MSSWWGRVWPGWSPPRRPSTQADGSSSSSRSRARTSAARPIGPSAGCSSSTAPSSVGWACATVPCWPGRTGRAPPVSTGSAPRAHPARTGMPRNGPARMSTSRPARSGPGWPTRGCVSSRSSGGPSAATAPPAGTATRCRGSTSRGAPVRGSASRSCAGPRRPRWPGGCATPSGTGSTISCSPAGGSPGSAGLASRPAGCRGAWRAIVTRWGSSSSRVTRSSSPAVGSAPIMLSCGRTGRRGSVRRRSG